MRPFGFVMFGVGLLLAIVGFGFVAQTPDTSDWTCYADTGASSSTCSFDPGDSGEGNPGVIAKASNGGLAITIVGAALVAGGLACAGGAGGGRQGSSYAAPVGPAFSGAAGSPPPAYGQQAQPSSTPPGPFGTQRS